MSLLWYWRYIPCAGVKLEFDQFDLYEKDGRTVVHSTRCDQRQKRKIFQKHIQEDPDRLFKNIEGIDFEIALASIRGDGFFLLDYAHVFIFLLMIRTGGWISAPVTLTHSTLNDPEVDEASYLLFKFCRCEADVSWRVSADLGRRTMDQIAYGNGASIR